jgi:hypothetical protein
LAVDLDSVSGNDSSLFHAVNPLDDSRRREADPPAQLRKVNARILLEFGQNAPSDGIEELGNIYCVCHL